MDEKDIFDTIIVIDTKLYGISLELDEARNAFRGGDFPSTTKALAHLSEELLHISQELKKHIKE